MNQNKYFPEVDSLGTWVTVVAKVTNLASYVTSGDVNCHVGRVFKKICGDHHVTSRLTGAVNYPSAC